MNKAPTISEQEELMERLKWQDDDVVLLLRNMMGRVFPKTRSELSRVTTSLIQTSAFWRTLDMQILMPFLTEDGDLLKPGDEKP